MFLRRRKNKDAKPEGRSETERLFGSLIVLAVLSIYAFVIRVSSCGHVVAEDPQKEYADSMIRNGNTVDLFREALGLGVSRTDSLTHTDTNETYSIVLDSLAFEYEGGSADNGE